MLNDHLVPMFAIQRTDVLEMFAAKLESLHEARATAVTMKDNATLNSDQEKLSDALLFIDETTAQVEFMRDHLADGPSWSLSAAQLVEVRTSLKPIKMNVAHLNLAVDYTKFIATEVHNFNGRMKRW